MGSGKLTIPIAASMVAAAAALLFVYTSGLQPAGALHEQDPVGNIGLDASAGDNGPGSVGPIGSTANPTDTPNDSDDLISVDLVIGDSNSTDANPSGGIPSGKDIGGWQVRINFDANVLTLVGAQVLDCSDGPATAQFFTEKASACGTFGGGPAHITLLSPTPAPGVGSYVIGDAIQMTPPGAVGVGLLARLFFDSVTTNAGTCIDFDTSFSASPIDIAQSFYTDSGLTNHIYANHSSVGLGVNGGTAPATCRAPTSATAGTTAATPSSGPEGPRPDEPAEAIGSPTSPGPDEPADAIGSLTSPGPFPSPQSEREADATAVARGLAEGGTGNDGTGSGDWIIPVIVSVGALAGLALIAGAAASRRRLRRRA